MKVIRDNRVENRFTFPMRLTCGHCKSELEADKSDLKYTDDDQRDPGYYYIPCPLCNTHNVVKPVPIRSASAFFNR
ncbi:hypothetical protein SAMN06269173_11175 [Hymenobacter mucosus]|uniref:Uncharacterized protein n=1 Tax=Hymenobacter mucosus TaxID=1411120 RepID=A0A239AB44_9BACT|nr:hypothetical protein SAMN06269173_11175 [Hymenobacter mucosus]